MEQALCDESCGAGLTHINRCKTCLPDYKKGGTVEKKNEYRELMVKFLGDLFKIFNSQSPKNEEESKKAIMEYLRSLEVMLLLALPHSDMIRMLIEDLRIIIESREKDKKKIN